MTKDPVQSSDLAGSESEAGLPARCVVGVDVGGTFTDLLLIDEGTRSFRVAKVPTSTGDQSVGFLQGIEALGVGPGSIDSVIHGTTAGTNAVLERKGAVCGLLTTRGFRDVLELGRRTRPFGYGMIGSFEALIPREFRLEVTERIDADGGVQVPLDEEDVRSAVRALLERGAEALVIHFIHSYINPSHELRACEIAREIWPNGFITVGSRTLSEMREFERGTAAAINGYIEPVVSKYISKVEGALRAEGYRRDLLIMQGNGGMMAAELAGSHAVHTVMSGPAAGAIAAATVAAKAGFPNAIGCDMGGTSFDVALIQGGLPAISNEKDLAYGVPIRVPMVDIHTIGAGGGSIARVDKAGILKVGPESAGSTPGPICYGRGGIEPTITDANMVLGRINPAALPGTRETREVDYVAGVLENRVGRPLGYDAVQAAAAIVAVANNQMAGAIRLVAMSKGLDPRDFVIFSFGGAGGLHAVALARELGIPKVLVPRYPGITSAMGCVLADIRHDYVQTINKPLRLVDANATDEIFREQAAAGQSLIAKEGVAVTGIDVEHEVDLLYHGQTHVLRIPVRSPGFKSERVESEFSRAYRERFDFELPEMMPMLVNLRTTVIGRRPALDLTMFSPMPGGRLEDAVSGHRRAYFDGQWYECTLYRREGIPVGAEIHGPAIVEQLDTTTFIDPLSVARADEFGNLIISVLE